MRFLLVVLVFSLSTFGQINEVTRLLDSESVFSYQLLHGVFEDKVRNSVVLAYQDGLLVVDSISTFSNTSSFRPGFWSLPSPPYWSSSFFCPSSGLVLLATEGGNRILAVDTTIGKNFAVVANISVPVTNAPNTNILTAVYAASEGGESVFFADYYNNVVFLVNCSRLEDGVLSVTPFDFHSQQNTLLWFQHPRAIVPNKGWMLLEHSIEAWNNQANFDLVQMDSFAVLKSYKNVSIIPPAVAGPGFVFSGFNAFVYSADGSKLIATYIVGNPETGASGPAFVCVLDSQSMQVLNTQLLNHINPTEYILQVPVVRPCVRNSALFWTLMSAFNHGFSDETTYARIQVFDSKLNLGPSFNDTFSSVPSGSLGYSGLFAFGQNHGWAAGSYQPTSFLTRYDYVC